MIKHRHHIIPKHMGGGNDPSNLTPPITVEEHAEAHRVLYEKHGKPQDYIAWKCLNGSLTNQEARVMASKLVVSKEITVNGVKYGSVRDAQAALGLSYRRIMKAVLEGRDPTKSAKDYSVTVEGVVYESLRKASDALGISRCKLKAGNIKEDMRKKKLVCPHCSKDVDLLNAKRWHFDNCKGKVL